MATSINDQEKPTWHGQRYDSGLGSLNPQSINSGILREDQEPPATEHLYDIESDHEDDDDDPAYGSLIGLSSLPPSSLPLITTIIGSPLRVDHDPQDLCMQADSHTVTLGHGEDSLSSTISNPMPHNCLSENLIDLNAPNEHQPQIEDHDVQENRDISHGSVDVGILDHDPMDPQLPSTLLSCVRAQPLEIVIREPVVESSDFILERVLVEQQIPSP